MIGRTASFSTCGCFRWRLERWWDAEPAKPRLGWIMLNPSTADDRIDDPTIRRCIGFSRAWGFAGCSICNIFALRSTLPGLLYGHCRPIGLRNDDAILNLVDDCAKIVVAWGVHGALGRRGDAVAHMLADAGAKLFCLGRTKDGHPRHPLYVHSNCKLRRYATLRRSVSAHASPKRRYPGQFA